MFHLSLQGVAEAYPDFGGRDRKPKFKKKTQQMTMKFGLALDCESHVLTLRPVIFLPILLDNGTCIIVVMLCLSSTMTLDSLYMHGSLRLYLCPESLHDKDVMGS